MHNDPQKQQHGTTKNHKERKQNYDETILKKIEYEPADFGRRITAAFIDTLVVTALFFITGWLGSFQSLHFINDLYLFWFLPIVYVLIRDMCIYDAPISVGKRIARLDVMTSEENQPDLVNSIQRNIFFFFPPFSLCMAGLELFLLIRTKDHKRFGDHFGKTTVVQRFK